MVGRSRGRRRGEHGQHAVAWLAALLVIGGLIAAPSGSATVRASAASASTISVTGTTIDRPIPSGFVGLGLEFRTVNAYAGNNARSLDPVFVQLGRTSLRASADPPDRRDQHRSKLVADEGRPPVARDHVQHHPQLDRVLRSLATATNARLLLGINLEDNSTSVAPAEVQRAAVGDRVTADLRLELGNEPELYTVIAWYREGRPGPPVVSRKKGTPVFSRPKGYNVHNFTRDFSRFRRALPHQPLAGPATGNFAWLTDLPQFLVGTSRAALGDVPSLRTQPVRTRPIAELSERPAPARRSLRVASCKGIGKYVAIAHNHHAGFLIDEMNSVTCNGRPGVSNAFASALWAVDALFHPPAPASTAFRSTASRETRTGSSTSSRCTAAGSARFTRSTTGC